MTGRTVEEAVEAALEQLGVAETDAEIVIVEEPKIGHVRSSPKRRQDKGSGAPYSTQGQEALASAENPGGCQ